MYATICIPTYNRAKFSRLIEENINQQDYPLIKEIIILDDGTEQLDIKTKYPVKYIKAEGRLSIGEKRNILYNLTQTQYIAYMDDDDLYNPSYISNSIFNLIHSERSISGSSDMFILDKSTRKIYSQRCMYLHLLNEATLVIDKKKLGDVQLFISGNTGEGRKLIEHIGEIVETDVEGIMICIAHNSNTIDKSKWLDEKALYSNDILNIYKKQLFFIPS